MFLIIPPTPPPSPTPSLSVAGLAHSAACEILRRSEMSRSSRRPLVTCQCLAENKTKNNAMGLERLSQEWRQHAESRDLRVLYRHGVWVTDLPLVGGLNEEALGVNTLRVSGK